MKIEGSYAKVTLIFGKFSLTQSIFDHPQFFQFTKLTPNITKSFFRIITSLYFVTLAKLGPSGLLLLALRV